MGKPKLKWEPCIEKVADEADTMFAVTCACDDDGAPYLFASDDGCAIRDGSLSLDLDVDDGLEAAQVTAEALWEAITDELRGLRKQGVLR